MSQGAVIRDFMVALGFQTDNAGLQKMQDGLKGVELGAASLNKALGAMAIGAVLAVRQTAGELDKLYFSSQRIHASAGNINAFGNAVSQMGGNAEAALGTLESLAEKMRNSPGYSGQLNSLGVQTKEANGEIRDRVEVMKDLSGVLAKMPDYQANAYANSLGIDQNTLLAMKDGKFISNMEKYQQLQKDMGMNDELTKSGNDFMSEYRDLTMVTKTGFQVIVMQAGKALIPILKALNVMIQAGIHAFGQLNPQIKEGLAVGLRFALLAGVFKMVVGAIGMVGKVIPMVLSLTKALKFLRLTILASPLGIVLALAAVIGLLIEDFKVWQEGGKSTFDWSKWANGFDKIISKIKYFLDLLAKVKDKAINFIQKIVKDPAGALQEFAETGIEAAKETIKKAEEKVPEIVQGGLNIAQKVGEAGMSVINPKKSTGTLYYGDSIAEGYKTANKGDGNTKVGASPKYIADEISKALKANKDIFKGKDVILSSGYSNNNQDLKSVAEQLKMLNDAGANVRLLGVAKNFKGDKALGTKMNSDLEALAKKMGVKFTGGFDASKDNVHPSAYKKGFADVALGGVKALQGVVQNIVGSPTIGKDKSNNRLAVYNAFISAGFSKNQALALTAEVGRENEFNMKTMFGTHTDLGNSATNLGFFSWQGDRKAKLVKFLKNSGVIDKNGNMIRGQKALDAMAKFAKHEIETIPKYSKTKSNFLENKDINPESAAPILGKNYIRWAYGQNFVNKGRTPFDWKGHDQRRRNHLNNIRSDVNKLTQSAKPNVTSMNIREGSSIFELPKGNPYKDQVNHSTMTASNVTIHQSFKTDMTLNGVKDPMDSAKAVQRQNENSMAIMMRNAQGVMV